MTMTPPEPDNTARMLLYLANERSAAITKIAFDLKLDATEAAGIIHALRGRGLVREAGGALTKMAQTEASAVPAYQSVSKRPL